MEDLPVLKVTTDYNKFEFMPDNRRVNMRFIKELKASMSEIHMQKYMPILVNTKYEIVDGQHRFTACKELGLPVYYFVVEDADFDMIEANRNQRMLQAKDYLDIFVARNNPHYVKLKKLMSDYHLGISIALALTTGYDRKANLKMFKTGQFKFPEDDNVYFVADKLRLYCQFAKERKVKPAALYNDQRIALAFLILAHEKKFDWDRFMKKLEIYWPQLRAWDTYAEYARMFLSIYNYGKTNKLKIKELV